MQKSICLSRSSFTASGEFSESTSIASKPFCPQNCITDPAGGSPLLAAPFVAPFVEAVELCMNPGLLVRRPSRMRACDARRQRRHRPAFNQHQVRTESPRRPCLIKFHDLGRDRLVSSATRGRFVAAAPELAGNAVGTGSAAATGFVRNGISFASALSFASNASTKYFAAQLGKACEM